MKPLIIIDENAAYRLEPRLLGDVSDILEEYVRTTPPKSVILRDVDPGGGTLVVNPAFTTLIREVETVRLHTHFAPVTDETGETYLVPVFTPTPVSAEMAVDWNFGAAFPTVGNAALQFAVSWVRQTGSDEVERTECALFVEEVPAQGREVHRVLPMANVFGDGRVCMGNEWVAPHPEDNTISEVWERAWEYFSGAKTNADLASDRAKEVIRVNPETMSTLPSKIELGHIDRVSNKHLQ